MDKKFYCNLKWDMAYINLINQTIAQCCKCDSLSYDTTVSDDKIIDIFNIQHLQKERLEIIDGQIPKSCQQCANFESHGVKIQNALIDERKNIQYDSSMVTKLPTRLDFTLYDFCNLSCAYCGPHASSSWTRDLVKHGNYPKEAGGLSVSNRDVVKSKVSLLKYSQSKLSGILKKITDHPSFSSVEKITLLGGDPLIMPQLIEIVENILSKNNHLKLDITTGLGVPDKTFYKVMVKLKEIDVRNQLIINVSGESTGKIFEFIRHGILWKDWGNRLQHLMQMFNKDQIVISSVLCILSLSDFKNFLEFLDNLGLDTKKVQFAFLDQPSYFALTNFDTELTSLYIQDLLDTSLLSDDLRQSLNGISNLQHKNLTAYTQFHNFIREFAVRKQLDINIFPKELINE
jgi:organic radical activating enzyme